MENLLKMAIDAHGGLDRWKQFEKIRIHMKLGGALWALKGQDGVISDTYFEADLKSQKARYLDFVKKGQDAVFTPDQISIIKDGQVLEELRNPRASFSNHKFETPWSQLQLVYFAGYAMTNYLTAPFIFTLPGFKTKEIEPWHEAGENLRRLHVTFPDNYAYHSKEQIFYFDENGLMKRFDYDVEISAGTPAAHYVFDYKDVEGIMVPHRREVYGRDEENHYVKEPLVVKIVLDDVKFS
jgi:hypothetical protein